MKAPTQVLVAALATACLVTAQSFQSTPVMGWNSFIQMGCKPNQQSITDTIHDLAQRGFVTAGYKFFQIDCGWNSRDGRRDSRTGSLKINMDAFPGGLKPLSDLARSKGMKWSMYSDAGVRMCDPQVPSPALGSLGHEEADARFFKFLNTEYLKYDNCYADGSNSWQNAPKKARSDFVKRYWAMWEQLRSVGIPGMLVCQWGVPFTATNGLIGPSQWTKGLSTSFRLSDDIGSGWSHVYRIYNQAIHIAKSDRIGPGNIADADLLQVGNPGMTFDEQATQFAAWALLKSSLMISTKISDLSDRAVALLQNRHLIAVNQDSAVKPVKLVQRWTGIQDVWMGPLANGDVAVLCVDLSNTRRTLNLELSVLGIKSADIKDLSTGGTFPDSKSIFKKVNGHGSLALRLSNIQRTKTITMYNYISIADGSLSSGAKTMSCSGCSSSTKVGFIGGSSNGQVVIWDIFTTKATQNVLFDYINADVQYSGGTNERLAYVQVNNQPARIVSFPLSGYDWDKDIYKEYPVELSGFDTNGPNTITISGVNGGWGPDLDRLGVVA